MSPLIKISRCVPARSIRATTFCFSPPVDNRKSAETTTSSARSTRSRNYSAPPAVPEFIPAATSPGGYHPEPAVIQPSWLPAMPAFPACSGILTQASFRREIFHRSARSYPILQGSIHPPQANKAHQPRRVWINWDTECFLIVAPSLLSVNQI
jgi:hypothetical protein